LPRRLPLLRADKHACESPHVVILGAGASRAACPDGDANGKTLPVMADLVQMVGLQPLLQAAGVRHELGESFEILYEKIASNPAHAELARAIETTIREYFAGIVMPRRATVYDRLLL